VRRIRLGLPVSDLQKLLTAIDEEFPMLEYLYLVPPSPRDTESELMLPTTFQAPRLRHLMLGLFSFPIRSPLLTTEAGLVTLTLEAIPQLAYFNPNDLLRQLSLMHQLQSLTTDFDFLIAEDAVDPHPLIMTRVTLPNLRSFAFQGESAYLEALLPQITTPLLKKLHIWLYNQRTLSVPHLLQFIVTTENLAGRLSSVVLRFTDWGAWVVLYPNMGPSMYSLCLQIHGGYLDWQVAFAAHVLDVLRPVLSEAVQLTLEYQDITLPNGWHNQTDRSQWRKLLDALGNL